MEPEPHSSLRRLRLQAAGSASAGGDASCSVCRVQKISCSLGWLPTGDAADVCCSSTGWARRGQVAVAAVVSAAEMLPVVQVSALLEGDTRPSPAASEGCPLRMMLVTVVEAADVQMVVQMAVQVAALRRAHRRTGCWAVLQKGWRKRVVLGCTRWHTGSSDGCPFDVPGLAVTTLDKDLVAEVLGWDPDILALGEGQGRGGIGKSSKLARKRFLDTLGQEDGGGLGVEEEVVVVGGVRLLNFGRRAQRHIGEVCMVVGVVITREQCVVMGVLVMEVVAEYVVHASVSGDETGREVDDVEEGDKVEAVDVDVSAWVWCLCECLWYVWCLCLPEPLLCIDECACWSVGVLGIG
ncbi:hypothetical protein NDU88_002351 [Pleurodeles waltl]|uniref:Uncharacterized protein n=1 Tax=Pleurodeles waltl TaxID=8319 RepID=A0AAV7VZ32_PLEWA|nr:hypothetical protein NDU88_002351 [Pleurodeles waltl]